MQCGIKVWTQASSRRGPPTCSHPRTTPTTTTTLLLSSVSLSLFERHVFISTTHVYITYTSLSPERVWGGGGWHRLRPPHSSLQHIRLPPTKNTFHPSLVKRIPICPRAKFQPCFLESSAWVSLPLRRDGYPPPQPPPHPHQAPKALHSIEGADTEVSLSPPLTGTAGPLSRC